MDPLRKISRGDSVGRVLLTSTFNYLIDAAKAARGIHRGEREQNRSLPQIHPSVTIWLVAHQPLPLGAVVSLGAPATWFPTDNPVYSAQNPGFHSANPRPGLPFLVLSEPAPEAGRVVRGVASGTALVRLRVGETIYPCADIIADEPLALQNVPHGPARVLQIENVESPERWAIVALDQSNREEYVLVLSNVPDSDGLFDGLVQRYDPDSGTWHALYPCKVLDVNR